MAKAFNVDPGNGSQCKQPVMSSMRAWSLEIQVEAVDVCSLLLTASKISKSTANTTLATLHVAGRIMHHRVQNYFEAFEFDFR